MSQTNLVSDVWSRQIVVFLKIAVPVLPADDLTLAQIKAFRLPANRRNLALSRVRSLKYRPSPERPWKRALIKPQHQQQGIFQLCRERGRLYFGLIFSASFLH